MNHYFFVSKFNLNNVSKTIVDKTNERVLITFNCWRLGKFFMRINTLCMPSSSIARYVNWVQRLISLYLKKRQRPVMLRYFSWESDWNKWLAISPFPQGHLNVIDSWLKHERTDSIACFNMSVVQLMQNIWRNWILFDDK